MRLYLTIMRTTISYNVINSIFIPWCIYWGSVTNRFCPRETSYGRSSGSPQSTLETSCTFFDFAEGPGALFTLQPLRLSVVPGPDNEHRST